MRLKLLSMAVLVVAWNVPAQSLDWPSFRGNIQQTGVTNERLPDDLQPVWSYQVEAGFEASAAIAESTIFIGALDGTFVALDLVSGKEKWKYAVHEEIKSTPAVDHGIVYFGDEKGSLHALDARTGEKKFTFQADAAITAAPAVSDEHILVGSYDQNLYCLKSDGSIHWKVETSGYVNGTPAVWNGMAVIVGCDGFLRLIQISDGAEKGKLKIGNYVGASPAVYNNHAFIGTFGNEVFGVDLKGLQVAWKYENPEAHFPFYSSAAVTEKAVFIGGRDKFLHALNPASGKLLWKFNAKSRVDSSPVVSGNKVYFGTVGGQVYSLAADSGKVVWQYDATDSIVSSPAIADEKLIIATKGGTLFCFGQRSQSS